jgi:predicted RNase H-like nuclease (RuvC/YqgF family)
VRRLLVEVDGFRARTQTAEQRAAELERTLREMSSGAIDPVRMRAGMRDLEEENEELRRRLTGARDRIRRLVARFDFLREEM